MSLNCVVLKKTLKSPLDSKIKPVNPQESQPWIFLGSTYAEAEAPILCSTWCEKPNLWKRPWCWLGKTERRKRRGWQRTRWLDSIDMSLSKLQRIVKDREAWHAAVHRAAKRWTRRSGWTTTTCYMAPSLQMICASWENPKMMHKLWRQFPRAHPRLQCYSDPWKSHWNKSLVSDKNSFIDNTIHFEVYVLVCLFENDCVVL